VGTELWYRPTVGVAPIKVLLCRQCIEVLPFSRALHERAELRVLLNGANARNVDNI
jgi:hypothetical protein